MSVREEEGNKNCPSRGLGIAAAAMGVGVGAALYCFFSKRPENPDNEGATSSSWRCETPQALHDTHDSSYTTISEHSTTDTSIYSDDETIMQSIARRLWNNTNSTNSESDSSDSGESTDSDESRDFDEDRDLDESGDLEESQEVDSDTNAEWDVTNSSVDVPEAPMVPFSMHSGEMTVRLENRGFYESWSMIFEYLSHHSHDNDDLRANALREQTFRERAWTLEECSICFESMLRDQEVLSLACTHRFHQACIMPWLQQRQTCPMCRTAS